MYSLATVRTGVTEKVTKIDHSFLGLSSPVLFPGGPGTFRGHHVWVCRSIGVMSSKPQSHS